MDSHGRSQGAIPMDDSQGDRNEDDGDPDSNQRPQRPIFDFTRPILAGSAAMAARQPSYIGMVSICIYTERNVSRIFSF